MGGNESLGWGEGGSRGTEKGRVGGLGGNGEEKEGWRWRMEVFSSLLVFFKGAWWSTPAITACFLFFFLDRCLAVCSMFLDRPIAR